MIRLLNIVLVPLLLTYTLQTVMLFIRASINFFSNLSYSSLSVASDHTDQPSLPTYINESRQSEPVTSLLLFHPRTTFFL